MNNLNWAFFGSSIFSVMVLNELKSKGLMPNLVVTIEDKPRGRKMIVTDEEVKVWANTNNIPYLQLKTLKSEISEQAIFDHFKTGADVFVVTHYGKMIPDSILNFPKYNTLNIHPSLLPKLRGASPIKSAILSENETGVTIIKLDSEMDHGPVLIEKKAETTDWPPYELDLKEILAKLGAGMLAEALPKWISGELTATEQNHSEATFCTKIEKKDGELNLSDNADTNLRKIRAFHEWPGAYFFETDGSQKTRVIVKKAHIENNDLIFDRIIPEGKKEMDYKDYLRGKKK